MKNTLFKTLSAIMAALMIISSAVPAFADTTYTISQTDTDARSYYDSSSSTLYIDQWVNTGSKPTASFDVECSSTESLSFDVTDQQLNGTEHVKCTEVSSSTSSTGSSGSYDITVSKNSNAESMVKFHPSAGTGDQKIINIKKCVPMTDFNISIDGSEKGKASSTQENIGSASSVQGDPVVISISNIKTESGTTTDRVIYGLYKDILCTEKVSAAFSYNENYTSAQLTCNYTGRYYILALAVSQTKTDDILDIEPSRIGTSYGVDAPSIDKNDKLSRVLKAIVPIDFIEFTGIDTMYFGSDTSTKTYSLATITNPTVNLSEKLYYAPHTDTDPVIYTSDNPSVASVDQTTGIVSAVSGGTANITAKGMRSSARGGGVSATCKIVVTPEIESMTFRTETSTLPLGHGEQITVITNPENAEEDITWSSSNPSALSVDQNGYVYANPNYSLSSNSENISITATSAGGVSASTPVTITNAVRADRIDVDVTKVIAGTKPVDKALITIEEGSEYSVYNGQKVSITVSPKTNDDNDSNDYIDWRVSVGSLSLVPLEDATDYIEYTLDGNNLQVKTSTTNNSTIRLTAYAILRGKDVSTATVQKTITLNVNKATTSISFSPSSTSMVLGNGTTSSPISVNLSPVAVENKDKIAVVSNKPSIASVSYDDSTKSFTVTANDLGSATVTVYACYDVNNPSTTYTSSKTLNVTVSNNIEAATVLGVDNVAYKGSAYTYADFPGFDVQFSGISLLNGTNYSLSYANNTNVGTATITITAKGTEYTGTKVVNFNINPYTLTGDNTDITVASSTYTGSPLTPNVTVKAVDLNNKTLTKNTDYTVSYSSNTNAGIGEVVIEGLGNYTGTIVKAFPIAQANVSSFKIAAIANQSYTGNAIKPGISATFNNIALTEGVDYTLAYSSNKELGTATITVTGKGNFTGEKTVTFKIVAANADMYSVSSISAATYTGSPITPVPTVKFNGTTLTKDVDYTLVYSNNTNAGTATLTVKGKGNYTGGKVINFKINPANVSGFKIDAIEDQIYNGTDKTPVPVVKFNDITVKNKTGFQLSYKNNINAGTATVTLTGAGNFTGTRSATFKISPCDVSRINVSGVETKTYNGSAQTQAPVLKYSEKILVKGTDYALSYKDNVNAGTAVMTITGAGNFIGTREVKFNIAKLSMDKVTVSAISNKVYTGYQIIPKPTVTYNNKSLVLDTDYSLSYSNNVNAGICTVNVNGLGNYTGRKQTTFVILPKKPTGLATSKAKTTSLTLTWNVQSEAVGYVVYSVDAAGKKTKIKVINDKNANTCTVKKLKAAKTYSYAVRAFVVDAVGTKYYSAYSATLVTCTKPKKPAISSLTAGKKKLKVKWGKVSGSGYEVQYSTSADFTTNVKTKKVKKSKTLSTTIKKLTSKKKYYVRVRAYKAYKVNGKSKSSYSGWSKVKNVKVK
jgi:hypothetical protein